MQIRKQFQMKLPNTLKKTTEIQFPSVATKSKKINDQFYDDCLIENEQCDGCSAQIESLKKQIVEATTRSTDQNQKSANKTVNITFRKVLLKFL